MSVILQILESEAGTRQNTPNWAEIEGAGQFSFENEKVGEKEVLEVESEAIWIATGKGKSVANVTATAADLRRSEKVIVDFAWGKGLKRKQRKDTQRGAYWQGEGQTEIETTILGQKGKKT